MKKDTGPHINLLRYMFYEPLAKRLLTGDSFHSECLVLASIGRFATFAVRICDQGGSEGISGMVFRAFPGGEDGERCKRYRRLRNQA